MLRQQEIALCTVEKGRVMNWFDPGKDLHKRNSPEDSPH